jgi:hypothetical protein
MFDYPLDTLDKVVVTQDIYQALNDFQAIWGKQSLFDTQFLEKEKDESPTVKTVYDYRQSVGDFLFSQAIFIGYEAEKSVEVKFWDYYHSVTDDQKEVILEAMSILFKKYPELKGVLDCAK